MPLSLPATAIARTLAFFAQFQRGLTLEELHRFAWGEPIDDVVGPLSELRRAGLVVAEGAYVTLVEDGVRLPASIQHERAAQAEPLRVRALRVARWIARLPFVRGVYLVNSLAMQTNHAMSDIDLLVVAASRRLWFVRALATIVVHLLGIRRHGERAAGRVCLSMFATDEGLALDTLRVAPDDVYLAYWIVTAEPLAGAYGRGVLLNANPWVRDVLPNIPFPPEDPVVRVGWCEQLLARLRLDRAGEWCARSVLRPRSLRHAARLGNPYGIVISDTLQKFHDVDKRHVFRTAWLARCARIEL